MENTRQKAININEAQGNGRMSPDPLSLLTSAWDQEWPALIHWDTNFLHYYYSNLLLKQNCSSYMLFYIRFSHRKTVAHASLKHYSVYWGLAPSRIHPPRVGCLNYWTGLVDWTSGLDRWTGLVNQHFLHKTYFPYLVGADLPGLLPFLICDQRLESEGARLLVRPNHCSMCMLK